MMILCEWKKLQSRPWDQKRWETHRQLSFIAWWFQHVLGLQEIQVQAPGLTPCHLYPRNMTEENNSMWKAFLTNANPSVLVQVPLGPWFPMPGHWGWALARQLPAPGANLQTHTKTWLGGAFCCLHHNLSPSPPQTWGCSLVPAVLLPDPPQAPHSTHSLAMCMCGQVGSSQREGSYLPLLHHHFPLSIAWL